MPRDIDRRGFVRRLPVLTAGLAGGFSTTALSACSASARYLVPVAGPRGLSIRRDAIGSDGAAFVQSREMERPIYLRRDTAGAWTALLASCTHRGCQPEPVGDRLVCPCHGSEFSMTGSVLEGPADRPLTRYEVVEEGDQLLVRTRGGRS
ncbi:MAG: Rieske (2Fe-2S) protein [Gemmatimonadota bacterium]|nr:Rieske (2Fe-2S) protein [Gemmatimonadota bacterium]